MSFWGRLVAPRGRFGWVEDEPDDRDFLLAGLGLPGAPPSSFSLAGLVETVLDQGRTNSCVAQAVAQGLVVAARAAGDLAFELPSRRFLYFHGRGYSGSELIDAGTRNRDVMRGQIDLGSPAERFCPWDPKLVNRSPSFGAYRHAWDQRGLRGFYRLSGYGDTRLEEIRTAIASRRPVIFGTAVSQDFSEGRGQGSAYGPPRSWIGRHAMLVVGYETGRFRVVNSWGRYWCESGFGWLSEDYLAWPDTKDLWALDLE